MAEQAPNNSEKPKNTGNRRFFPISNKPKTPGSGGSNFYWIYGVITLLFIGSYIYNAGNGTREIKTDKFNYSKIKLTSIHFMNRNVFNNLTESKQSNFLHVLTSSQSVKI